MKNKKLLFILIPVIIIVLVLIAGVVFLKVNSSSKNIFKHSISKAFEMFENSEEKYSTMKGSMNLTANVESDNEDTKVVNTLLSGVNIGLNMETDTANMIVNENISVKYNKESLLNATILLQDEKGYVYLPDWLDKYLQISEDDLEYSELTDYYKKISTLDQSKLMNAIKEELLKVLDKQDFKQTKVEKRTISTLDLSQEEFIMLSKELLVNLRQNENFNNALGEYKTEIIQIMDEMIEEIEDAEYDEEARVQFSIITEGAFNNKFVGFDVKLITDEDIDVGMLLDISEKTATFEAYSVYDGEKEEVLKVTIVNQKENENKGKATITVTAEEEEFVIVYNYEEQDNKIIFDASTEIEGVKLIISGDTTENGKNYKGNLAFIIEEAEMGKVSLNCEYDFTYGVEVQKVDTRNSVLIDDLSEKDQEELFTNLQDSTLYKILNNLGLFNYAQNAVNEVNQAIEEEQEKESKEIINGKVIINGIWYDSVDDYMNNKPSVNQ